MLIETNNDKSIKYFDLNTGDSYGIRNEKQNFSFVDFTVDEAVEYLSSKYNVQFSVEMIGKKKIYNVEPKKK
jgi:hypothetical protein